jgi:hypothetical protein
MSIVTAFIVSNVSAADLSNVPMAKTYPMNTESKVTQVATPVVKKVKESTAAPAKVAKAVPTVDYDAKIKKLENSIKKLKKSLSSVKAHGAKDNIKFGADLRTAMDRIEYKTASGKTYKNNSLFSNRLWINMAYSPSDNMVFKGQLSYNKAYGASPKMIMGMNQRGSAHSYDVFDWVTNETLTNDTIKLKEAYWLYMNDTFLGSDVSWTASFGRRPSVNGFLISLRDDDKPSSPVGHIINMEFDGASFKWGLDKLTGIDGMSFKTCFGRGLTNARARFNMDAAMDGDPTNDFHSFGDYSKDKNTLKDIDLAGFIFVPYDNGQYKILTTYYRAFNLPGFVMADPNMINPSATAGSNTGMMSMYDTDGNGIKDTMGVNSRYVNLKNLGDMDGAAVSILVDGIGDGISDFLDNTKFFASFAWSKSMPDNSINSINTNAFMQQVGGMMQANGLTQAQAIEAIMQNLPNMTPQQMGAMMQKEGMLGSNEDETGTSYWIGLQWPCLLVDGAKVGAEFNHGSKYWRSFTYGEDTLIGSKMATRGDAYEAYYILPLTKGFSAELRYTKIEYDYTGSQGFFGGSGVPMTMNEAKAFGMDPIEEAEDIRISFRYRF